MSNHRDDEHVSLDEPVSAKDVLKMTERIITSAFEAMSAQEDRHRRSLTIFALIFSLGQLIIWTLLVMREVQP